MTDEQIIAIADRLGFPSDDKEALAFAHEVLAASQAGAEPVAWGTRLPSGAYHAVRTNRDSAEKRTVLWNSRYPRPPHAVTVGLCEMQIIDAFRPAIEAPDNAQAVIADTAKPVAMVTVRDGIITGGCNYDGALPDGSSEVYLAAPAIDAAPAKEKQR